MYSHLGSVPSGPEDDFPSRASPCATTFQLDSTSKISAKSQIRLRYGRLR